MNSTFDDLLKNEHPDVRYLKREDISLVLSKALTETYQAKPNNPVEFFAQYLLNHHQTQKEAAKAPSREKEQAVLKKSHQQRLRAAEAEKEKQVKEAQQKQDQQAAIFQKWEKSDDLNDNLEELAEYICDFTEATGCYIGRLQPPMKNITDDADEDAHQDMESPLVIKISHASFDHKFMIDKVLKNNEGISHEVFVEAPVQEEEQQQIEQNPEDNLEQKEAEQAEEKDILETFKHIYVPEVVREPKMHFWKVPRLGAFLAVPLVYKSVLFEEAFDAAVADYLDVKKRQADQEREKAEYLEQQEILREEKAKNGEEFVEEEKVWDEIHTSEFRARDEKLVICIDTLGQDQEISDEKKRFVLQTVDRFRAIWEKEERDNLEADIQWKLGLLDADTQAELEALQVLREEQDKEIEEKIAEREDLAEEEIKQLEMSIMRLRMDTKQFQKNGQWRKSLENLVNFKVLKMPRIMQSLFYFLRFDREQICEVKSNKLFWKNAKKFVLDESINRMDAYKIQGPKNETYAKYQTLNFIEQNIAHLDAESVEAYHPGVAKLYRWLLTAIDLRKKDIIRRKAHTKKAKEERALRINQRQERDENRQQYLADGKEKFQDDHRDEIEAYQKWQEDQANKDEGKDGYGDEEAESESQANQEPPVLPVFNEEEYLEKFDEEFPDIFIPDEVVDDIDNDWVFTEEEEAEAIDKYWSTREESK